MMNYRVEPNVVAECEARPTVNMDIQETYSCLLEISLVLNDFMAIIFGNNQVEKDTPKDASCLLEQGRMMTSLAHDNLRKLNEIKNGIC